MSNKYIIKDSWLTVSNEEREIAIFEGQVFICKIDGLNYKTLEFGVFDPNINDTIFLIAAFRTIGDAIIFVNARF
jgi:hypothetical protein